MKTLAKKPGATLAIGLALTLGLLASGCSSTSGDTKPQTGQQATGQKSDAGKKEGAKKESSWFKSFDYHPAEEIPKGKGAFTGDDGSVVIVGNGGIVGGDDGEGGETAESKPKIPTGLVGDKSNRKRDTTYLEY